jgi:cytochrome b
MRDGELPLREVVVWDLPTRVFHWALVASVVGSVTTVQLHWMAWHAWFGYAILTLVIWRVLWGFLGSESARFAHFLKGPSAVLAHLGHLIARRPDLETSHNPLGGWAVVALLLLVGAQATTGLFANDDILFRGPLAASVGKAMSDRITGWHYRIKDLLLVMIALHIAAAILYWIWPRHRLVEAMVTGRKRLPPDLPPPRLAGVWRALALLVPSAALVWGIVTLG